MCAGVALEPRKIESSVIDTVLARLRASFSNGWAVFASLKVGADSTFDWYASRNRLLEFEILQSLLHRKSVSEALPDLMIPDEGPSSRETGAGKTSNPTGFQHENQFLFDGQLAAQLFNGGAYSTPHRIEAKEAKQLAMSFCDALFALRYEDISLFTSYDAWTPWFYGIAWDWTAVLFDRRDRTLSILAVTDTD